MDNVDKHAASFATIAARTCADMFGIETRSESEVQSTPSVETNKSFIISIYYTGTVYGEYLLAMDEQTAAKMIGIEDAVTDQNRELIRSDVCDAMSEMLNTIVGEAIVGLQETYAKLTITAPRIYFGEVRYPSFRTDRVSLQTDAGEIECHFCLDLMRLDLAASYTEAMDSLVVINTKLEAANRRLADQQTQLVHSAKMASVGVLASGVAHEINNPLFFVDGNLTTLTDYIKVIDSTIGLYETLCESLGCTDGVCPPELSQIQSEVEEHDLAFVLEDTKELVQETREGVARIKAIVQGLKDFSQVDRCGTTETNLNEVVENTCNLIQSQFPENCDLVLDLVSLPNVVCNAGDLGQALSGVLLNASQALPNGGTIPSYHTGHGLECRHQRGRRWDRNFR